MVMTTEVGSRGTGSCLFGFPVAGPTGAAAGGGELAWPTGHSPVINATSRIGPLPAPDGESQSIPRTPMSDVTDFSIERRSILEFIQ
jgi:hypothetical protein